MRQQPCGAWVSEMKDRDKGHQYWIGSLQSRDQVARTYDMQAVCLHDIRVKIEVPRFVVVVDPRVVSHREVWENREAIEWIHAMRANVTYMAELRWNHPEFIVEELRRNHPELVAEELRVLELYKKGANDAVSSVGRSLTFTPVAPSWIGRRS